jgi:CheY-like chemotaxis protein
MTLKVLLAEANVASQNAGKKILASGGHDVVTVSNGLAALKKINEEHPDIVLLDVYMAGCTGVDVCKKVKATTELAQIPVLLTVGKMEPFGAGEAIKSKADGLITKPFDVANLITVVERLAAGRRPPQSNAAGGSGEFPSSTVSAAAAHVARVGVARVSDPCFAPDSATRQGGEICDVCGHVNQKLAIVCAECDVPLPSSVQAHAAGGQ